MKKEPIKKRYLGDGVYAEYDGWGIWVRANSPNTDNIYLEPAVIAALKEFWRQIVAEQSEP